MRFRPLLASTAALLLAAAVAPSAPAQSYPGKPVRVIVPGPAGGGGDILARLVANELATALRQQMVVDNRPGASGMIGAELAARATPDGYTLFMGHSGTQAINVSIQSHIRYDPVRDFAPIRLVAVTPNVLVGHPSLPPRSVGELIAFARARPDRINYASGGVGFSQHLAGVLFCQMAGVRMQHVPYKGGTPALTDVVGGNVELMFPNIPAAIAFIRAGRLRVYGVTSAARTMALPDTPTIAEAGLPGYEAVGWFGLFAPAKTSPAIVRRVSDEVARILRNPEVLEQLRTMGADPADTTPEQFADFVAAEIRKWAAVVKASGAAAQD